MIVGVVGRGVAVLLGGNMRHGVAEQDEAGCLGRGRDTKIITLLRKHLAPYRLFHNSFNCQSSVGQ